MPNLALYRKYRPTRFSDVVGQETITRILKNQIMKDRVGHAYLLSGIRGTGKTTIAKIFARAVNCEHPVNGEACGECETCKLLAQDNNMNIIEIDAASNRGVDEIRNLRETIKYPPNVGKYKVYIIDEVHMLTKEAFNALLKTLEEPPSHAKFVLATTEAHRLPATILSRLQRFNIRPITEEAIFNHLKEICKKENINIDDAGLKEIAERGAHCMRDALSLLDQCADLNLPGELITEEEIRSFLGIAPKTLLTDCANLIAQKDGAKVLELIKNYRSQGGEDSLFLEDLTRFFQNLLYFKITKTKDKNYLEEFDSLSEAFSLDELYNIIDILLNSYSRLRFNALSEIVTNTALLSISSEFTPIQKTKESKKPAPVPKNQKKGLSQKVEEPPFEVSDKPQTKVSSPEPFDLVPDFIEPEIEVEPEIIPEPKYIPPKNVDLKNTTFIKNNILSLAQQKGEKLIKELLETSELINRRNNLILLLDEQYSFVFSSPELSKKVKDLFFDVLGKDVPIHPMIKQKYEEHLKKLQAQNEKKEAVKPPEPDPNFNIENHIKSIVGDNIPYRKVEK